MAAKILDGKAIAADIRSDLKTKVDSIRAAGGREPGLAVVLVGEDPASQVYVRNKRAACAEVGFHSELHLLSADTTQAELLALIDRLNADARIDGILIQLPLPAHIDESVVTEHILPTKDVDGFHPYNMGMLLTGSPTLVPCTPKGIMVMLQDYGVELKGRDAVIIGRSNIVGKPIALLPMMEHATITICHSRTKNLEQVVSRADIVVAAIGKAEMVKGSWIKEGAVVIDVGVNRTESGLKGDVEFGEAEKRASLITPVPGGVGPMTITMLLENTLAAARAREGKS